MHLISNLKKNNNIKQPEILFPNAVFITAYHRNELPALIFMLDLRSPLPDLGWPLLTPADPSIWEQGVDLLLCKEWSLTSSDVSWFSRWRHQVRTDVKNLRGDIWYKSFFESINQQQQQQKTTTFISRLWSLFINGVSIITKFRLKKNYFLTVSFHSFWTMRSII